MGSLRNALTAGSTDFSASGLVSLGSGQVPGFDQVAFYQHLVVSALSLCRVLAYGACRRQVVAAETCRPRPPALACVADHSLQVRLCCRLNSSAAWVTTGNPACWDR